MSTHGIAAERLDADLECLALTVYHEARGEPEQGKLAVAHTVINRAEDARFPRRICDVVYQHVGSSRGACEFSWTCDALTDEPSNPEAWRNSLSVARRAYFGLATDPTEGAMWYHANYVEPDWAHNFGTPQQIGRHLFYRDTEIRTAAVGHTEPPLRSPANTAALASDAGYSLPVGTTEFLKQMHVTMILFSPLLPECMVRINDVMYRQGDPISQGLTLASIAPDAIIVRYQDRLFRFSL